MNLSDANLQALLLGIGSVLALTRNIFLFINIMGRILYTYIILVPFLYLASLRNTGGSSTGGYGYGYGYQQQRKFNIFNPLMPKIESPW